MNKFLFLVGLVFLIISIGFAALIPFSHTSQDSPGKISLSQPIISCGLGCGGSSPFLINQSTLASDLIVKYEWPKHMDINDSESISVALTLPPAPLPPSLSVPLPSPTPIGNVSDRGVSSVPASSLVPEAEMNCFNQGITDPHLCQISKMFGDGYTLSAASAYMVTTSFATQLLGPVDRSTNQPFVEWDWNISPKSAGSQVLTAGINLQWTPTGKVGGAPIVRQLWEAPIAIQVNLPFLTTGQLTMSSILSSIFAVGFAGFSLKSVWVWWKSMRRLWRRKRAQQKKKRRFCQHCGAENPDDFEYCKACGKQRMPLPGVAMATSPAPSSSGSTDKSQTIVGQAAGLQQAPPPDSAQKAKK